MKILVSVKRVIDPDSRLKLTDDGTGLATGSLDYKLNPFDENAVEEAMLLNEAHGGEVVLVSIGPDDWKRTIKTGLAMGADRAIRVDSDDEQLDSDLTARILAAVYEREKPDLFLLGKQAIDGDNNQVGQLLAEYLNIGQACFASEVLVEANGDAWSARVVREVDGGLETIQVPLPAVITADLRLNEPRYPAIRAILGANSKPFEVLSIDDLGITDTALKVEVVRLEMPPERQAGIMVESVDELIDKLRNEARVL